MLLYQYNSEWVTNFELIKQKLELILPSIHLIEHVGSTAVEHLDAKPIIDIDIVYQSRDHFNQIKIALEQVGYYHNGNQGIENRDVFKRNSKIICPILDTIKHHLYVCLAGSKALERHILTRNYLRKHEWARIQYQQMKYDIAVMANQNKKTYAALKELYVNDFIDSIIEREKQEQQLV